MTAGLHRILTAARKNASSQSAAALFAYRPMAGLIAQRSTRYFAARLAPALLGLALLGGALSGCASGGGGSGMMFFADPGKYQFHTCEQLVQAQKGFVAREQELRDLMQKA